MWASHCRRTTKTIQLHEYVIWGSRVLVHSASEYTKEISHLITTFMVQKHALLCYKYRYFGMLWWNSERANGYCIAANYFCEKNISQNSKANRRLALPCLLVFIMVNRSDSKHVFGGYTRLFPYTLWYILGAQRIRLSVWLATVPVNRRHYYLFNLIP